jgi:5-(carboxyamino)imidazole ribonucleotide mutase
MTPKVSIIMGSTSDMAIMETAARLLDEFGIPFEINALSAHRTLAEVDSFARSARERGIQVIIAAAGMAAHLPGVIASITPLPVIGVPIKASLEGIDSLFSIVQMPPGIPVATVAVNGALNSALLAIQIMAVSDDELMRKFIDYKERLKEKIVKANKEISQIKYKFKTN